MISAERIAALVEAACAATCERLGHFGGCWLLNSLRSPLYRPWVWSTKKVYAARMRALGNGRP